MMARFAFLDFDGTLSSGYISMDFHRYLTEKGLFCRKEHARQLHRLKEMQEGRMSFTEWVMTIAGWGDGLRGQQVNTVQSASKEFYGGFRSRIYPSSYEIAEILTSHGFTPVLVSAGMWEVMALVASDLGIHEVIATMLGIEDGLYTGEVTSSLHMPSGKIDAIHALLKENGAEPGDCLACGDSFHDVPMLEAVGHPIALNPSIELERVAKERGWPRLTHESVMQYLNGLLEGMK